MRTKIILLTAGIIFLGSFSANLRAQKNAKTILAEMDRVLFAPKDRTADLEMIMVNLDSGKKRIKKAVLMQKGADKKLFIYTYPQSDKGIGTLTTASETYLYIPMFKKPKKITNMSESNTFNTSDFSLEDTPSTSYSATYIPELTGQDKNTWTLKLVPKSSRSPYGFLMVTVHKTFHYPETIAFYSKNGKKMKVAEYHFIKPGKYWAADVVTMKDLKKHHSTKIVMSHIKFDLGLKDSLFTPDNLVRLAEEKRAEKKGK